MRRVSWCSQIFENQILPLEIELAEIWTGTSGTSSGFLVFWFSGTSGFLVPMKTKVSLSRSSIL
jgi:hypothetical protein